MLEVVLKNIRIQHTHGLFPEEELTGGEFEVNLVAAYEPLTVPILKIEDTIDYTILYSIVKERMMKRTQLLETLVTEIALEIMDRFEIVREVKISIHKLNAPVHNFQGIVGVSYQTKRDSI